MKICFIDDDVSRNTLDVIEALREYGKEMHIPMECELLVVAFDWDKTAEDTYGYFKNKYLEKGLGLTRCDTEECLIQKIKERLHKEVCFMVDLHLQINEEDKLDNQLNYECLSMRVLNLIKDEKYHMYSLSSEASYKDKWCKQFKKLYREDIPNIFQCEKLKPGSFSKTIANEILEVNKGKRMNAEKSKIIEDVDIKPKTYSTFYLAQVNMISLCLLLAGLFVLGCGILLGLLICNLKLTNYCENGHRVQIYEVYCDDCGAVTGWDMAKKVCVECNNWTTDLESTFCYVCGGGLTLQLDKSEFTKYDADTLFIKAYTLIMIGILIFIIRKFVKWHIKAVTLARRKREDMEANAVGNTEGE